MKNNKGFSLVELIVVIAIMAILAAIAVVGFSIYIDRANDAADFEYLSNLTYMAELYAIENQLGLDSVVVSDEGVDGPEDIGLWIIVDPVTGEKVLYSYPKYESIREIYDAIGDWDFKGEGFKDEADFKPEYEEDKDNSNEVDNPCANDLHNYVTTQVDSTCQRKGYIKNECSDCGKVNIQELDLEEHKYSDTPQTTSEKYSYYICIYDGCSHIQIKSSDGSVIVPIN